MNVRGALAHCFTQGDFKDGGADSRFFQFKLGPLMIRSPNIPARVEAVKIHGLHHVLTGCRADWKGEVEIAGWELGSGCGRYWVAWLLNMGSFTVGLFLYPRALMRAFRTGRTVPDNLYQGVRYDDALLDKSVGDLRRWIYHGANRQPKISVPWFEAREPMRRSHLPHAHRVHPLLAAFHVIGHAVVLLHFVEQSAHMYEEPLLADLFTDEAETL